MIAPWMLWLPRAPDGCLYGRCPYVGDWWVIPAGDDQPQKLQRHVDHQQMRRFGIVLTRP